MNDIEVAGRVLMARWQMTTRRLQQVAAGEVIRAELAADATPELTPLVERMSEGVLREVGHAPPDRRLDVVIEAVRTPGRVTAAKIKQARARLIEPEAAPPPCCPTCNRPL